MLGTTLEPGKKRNNIAQTHRKTHTKSKRKKRMEIRVPRLTEQIKDGSHLQSIFPLPPILMKHSLPKSFLSSQGS